MLSIFAISSSLHQGTDVDSPDSFIEGLDFEYSFKGSDFSSYGEDLSVIYVMTGGTEGVFRDLLPWLLEKTRQTVLLLASDHSNSLAASVEILSYLRQRRIRGEILHGKPSYIRSRLEALGKVESARRQLEHTTFGVIGDPSDWLISSEVDREALSERLGISIQYIPMEELLEEYSSLRDEVAESWDAVVRDPSLGNPTGLPSALKESIPGAYRIYKALKGLVSAYGLNGFTIRCFDLLTAVKNTGCLALAKLNSEGLTAGCEGDIPAMISMAVGRAACGVSGFQANPSSIDPESGEIVFSHCTVPLDMVSGHELDTHFESGIGVGIRGHIPEGPVTVFKVSGDLSRHFVCEGELVSNGNRPDLCRTQVLLKLPAEAARYFLNEPIGNHHIILPGHCASVLEDLLK